MSDDIARPLAEWHEDEGDVLWWKFPISEAPYVGSPLDTGYTVTSILYNQFGDEIGQMRADVGGWPGYHTHWTPMVKPAALPKGTRVRLVCDDHDIPAGSLGTIERPGGIYANVALDVLNMPGSTVHSTVSLPCKWLELAPDPDPEPARDANGDDILF